MRTILNGEEHYVHIDDVSGELHRLKQENEKLEALLRGKTEGLKALLRENEKLVEALEFYAEFSNWCIYNENDTGRILMVGDDYDDSENIPPSCTYIGGKRARQMLDELGGSDGRAG